MQRQLPIHYYNYKVNFEPNNLSVLCFANVTAYAGYTGLYLSVLLLVAASQPISSDGTLPALPATVGEEEPYVDLTNPDLLEALDLIY